MTWRRAGCAARRAATHPPLVAIATKHGKEHQLGPPLHQLLGWRVVRAEVDTDAFGTFSGEVERVGGPLEVALAKARAALEATGADWGMASEGTFGPHPDALFATVGVEHVAAASADGELEVVEVHATLDVVAGSVTVADLGALDAVAGRLGFPTHALVVRSSGAALPIAKGIVDRTELDRVVRTAIAASGSATVEVDLRAHANPTRRRAIAQAGERLARRLARRCPTCEAPGWGVIEVVQGRRCEVCTTPTELVAADILGCARRGCERRERRAVVGAAPAASCPWCNP